MNFLLWLILVSSVRSSPTENSRRSSPSYSKKELSNKDILKALSILMKEKGHNSEESETAREGRNEFDDEFSEEGESLEELDRQSFSTNFSPLEKCTTTGFETRVREECEEVSEVECTPIQIKKFRTEIEARCETKLDRQNCNVTYTGVPKQQCSPKTSKRCEVDFNIVEETLYKEECKVNVQHICEEHIKVPVPYPVKTPYPSPDPETPYSSPLPETPYPGPHPKTLYPGPHPETPFPGPHPKTQYPGPHPETSYIGPHPETSYPGPHPETSYPGPHPKKLFTGHPQTHNSGPHPQTLNPGPHPEALFVAPEHPPYNPKYRNYLTTPVPPVPPPSAYQASVLGEPLVGNLFKRQKRAAVDEDDNTIQSIVKQVLLEAMQKKKLEMKTDKEEGTLDALHFPIDSSPENPFNIPHNLLPINHFEQSQHIHTDHLLHAEHHFHGDHTPHLIPAEISNSPPSIPAHSHNLIAAHPPHLIPAHPPNLIPAHPPNLIPAHPAGLPAAEHPPIVTSYELPAPPGCRSLATKTCWKIPIIVPKKVPFETCREVPDVECVTVVKNKPEVECTPEPYQDCNDVAKDIPYLQPGEDCEEIFFDECREIEEKVPLELCKRKRIDEESIFLTRGQVFRKEGEVRRRKIGKKEAEERRRVPNRRPQELIADYDDEN